MQTAMERLYDKLPNIINCTDDYRYGAKELPKEKGISKRYIQINSQLYQHAIVLDHDQKGFMADLRFEYGHLPQPNIVIANKDNGKAHSIFLLNAPVPKTEKSHKHPIVYCRAIEKALTEQYNADQLFTGRLVKSPFCKDYNIHLIGNEPYSLGNLSAKLDLTTPVIDESRAKQADKRIAEKREKTEGHLLGRNCHLFDMVRVWAYETVKAHRYGSFDGWHGMVMQEALCQNFTLNSPLSHNEVKALAKSIARWVWDHDSEAQERFSALQAYRGKLGGMKSDSSAGGQARSAMYGDQREQAKALFVQGMNKAKIADSLGVSRMTVHRWLEQN